MLAEPYQFCSISGPVCPSVEGDSSRGLRVLMGRSSSVSEDTNRAATLPKRSWNECRNRVLRYGAGSALRGIGTRPNRYSVHGR